MTDEKYLIAREKTAQAAEILGREDIDAWLILTREGSDPSVELLIGAKAVHAAAIFLSADGRHTILTSESDRAHFEETAVFDAVVTYGSSLRKPLLSELDRRAPKRLALNVSETDHLCDGLTRGLYLWLEETVGRNRLSAMEVSSEPVLKELRSIKSPTELDKMRKAITITCDIYDVVRERIRCGMSEREIGELFVEEMEARDVVNGIEHAPAPPLVCLIRAGLAHRGPGDTASEPGDMMVVDFSVEYSGYASDIARTFYFLRPGERSAPEEVQRAFDTTVGAVSAVYDVLRPGARGYEVDAAGRSFIENAGYPTIRHSTGHQVGREAHDGGVVLGPRRTPPRPAVEGVVQAGEVYAVEPTVIQDDKKPSCIVEDNVLVTEDGIQVLSRRQTKLWLIPCGEGESV